MKYEVGEKTLLGEIDRCEENSCYCYRVENKWWLTEPDVDKIIIKPKRNIDHIIELWESGKRLDAEDLYTNLVDKSDSMAGDVLVLLDSYTEPKKYPKLTSEEIKALKLARYCGFNWITKVCLKEAWLSDSNVEDDPLSASAKWIPSLAVLNGAKWLTKEPMSISELLDAQEVDK